MDKAAGIVGEVISFEGAQPNWFVKVSRLLYVTQLCGGSGRESAGVELLSHSEETQVGHSALHTERNPYF